MTTELQVEITLYEEHRAEWLRAHPDAFVVIQDNTIVEGFFDTYGEAIRAGLRQFGENRSFLVRQIRGSEPIYFYS